MNKRKILVECETRPRISRLKEKGRRRREERRGDLYLLVVPSSEYVKRDWTVLRGYFDAVLGYDMDANSFTCERDLRALGPLRDLVLDSWMPVWRSRLLIYARRWLMVKANKTKLCASCLTGRHRPCRNKLAERCRPYKLVWGDEEDRWVYPYEHENVVSRERINARMGE